MTWFRFQFLLPRSLRQLPDGLGTMTTCGIFFESRLLLHSSFLEEANGQVSNSGHTNLHLDVETGTENLRFIAYHVCMCVCDSSVTLYVDCRWRVDVISDPEP